ncbi:MAG TPA: glycosyltransferase family 2 protein, partial [Longimicrobiales bacterium]|nr:glycosyltransferase family 2 protein [Longimicrobiales bacterium]
GQGAALRTGMEYALRREAGYIVTFDADGQHDEATIPRMIAALEAGDVDVVLGSRFLGSSPGIPRARRLLLRAATLSMRLSTGLALTDVHNGLRGFTASAARILALSQNRMAHASEILNAIGRSKLRWMEIPTTVRYTDYSRAKGQSGLGAVNIVYDLFMKRWFP